MLCVETLTKNHRSPIRSGPTLTENTKKELPKHGSPVFTLCQLSPHAQDPGLQQEPLLQPPPARGSTLNAPELCRALLRLPPLCQPLRAAVTAAAAAWCLVAGVVGTLGGV